MSLFGSSKEVYVGTTVSRVIPDDSIPNSIKTGLIKGLFNTEGNTIVDHVIEDMLGSIGSRGERYFKYGKEGYYYGLPAQEVLTSTQGSQDVENIIEQFEGEQVNMEYVHYGPFNLVHYALKMLTEVYEYDSATNRIGYYSNELQKDIYLKDLKIVISQDEFATLSPLAFEVRGQPPSARQTPESTYSVFGVVNEINGTPPYIPYKVVPSLEAKYIEIIGVSAEQTDGSGSLLGETGVQTVFTDHVFTFAIVGADETKEYFHALYQLGEVDKYWTYEVGSGQYPVLDALIDTPLDPSGTYFPVLHFRHNFTSMAQNQGQPDYASSVKLAKKIGLDFDSMVESIHENPGIDDVIQAAMLFAVPANTTDQTELAYLFDFFREQYPLQNPIGSSEQVYARRALTKYVRNAVRIKDQRFNYALTNRGIFKNLRHGYIGSIGTHALVKGEVTIEEKGYNETIGEFPVVYNLDTFTYCKQITANVVEEIKVVDLQAVYFIQGIYAKVGNQESKIILVPLDHSITTTYSIPVREVLYSRAMHFVFNSYVEVELAFYQQEWFQMVLIAVTIIIVISTYGQAIQLYAAAVAAGTVTVGALLYGLALLAIEKLLYAIAIKMFIKEIGAESALAIAVLIAVSVVMGKIDPTLMSGITAQTLVDFSTNLVQLAQEVVAEDFQALLEEQSEFDKEMTKQMKTLETAEELLERTFPLNPLAFFSESPDGFYNRTVHSGNIGLVGISAVSSYVDAALTLPTIDQTIGEQV